MTAASPLLSAVDLAKTYGEGHAAVEALRGVSLTIGSGEFVAIMGPSGSGKSTLLHLLGGLDIPSRGRIVLDGSDLAAMSEDERTLVRRRRVGFVFQAFNLLPVLTAEENVAVPLTMDGVPDRVAAQRAAAALALTGLAGRGEHFPSELSGGEQQRVAIARALVNDPMLILADEPTGNLDSTSGDYVMHLLRRLVDERRQTVVMVTHDPRHAALADRIVRLADGSIVDDRQFPPSSPPDLKVQPG